MRQFLIFILMAFAFCGFKKSELETLSLKDQKMIHSALQKMNPLVEKRMESNDQMLLTYDELFAPLSKEEKKLIIKIRDLKPRELNKNTPFLGYKDQGVRWVILKDQWVAVNGVKQRVSPAAVPENILQAYERMMKAMEKDLGKKLFIESGYRSGAYQIYLFIFYLKKRNYSILDTSKWNALPGYSEHGFAPRLALDLINEEGVNGDMNPEAFEKLDEYKWLLKHARNYGFVLSFPRTNPAGIGFEPWHWRYEGASEKA